MEFLFGGRKTVDEQLRANKRAIARAVRELDGERRRLEQDKTRITGEIKKLAKQNEMEPVRILAKQIVRNDNYIKRFTMMRTNLEALGLKLQTLKSTNAMAEAMKKATVVMRQMNTNMKLPQLNKIMMEFEKQSGLLESKEEMMNDALDDALSEDGDVEETDAVVNKVLEDLGIEMSGELAGIPSAKGTVGPEGSTNRPQGIAMGSGGKAASGPTEPTTTNDSEIDENDLEARLARLKRG